MSLIKDPNIIIRDSIDGDEKSLAILLHNNFPNAPEPEKIQKTWCWQFRNCFSKNGGVAVAQCSDEVVAQYAVMCFPMIYKGQSIDGAVSTATATDKSVRGQGLFTKLAAKVYQDIAMAGTKIVYGFPNSQSVNGFIKHLAWFEVAPFPVHIKPVDTLKFIEKIIGHNAIARLLRVASNVFLRLIFGAVRPRHRRIGINIKKVNDIPDALDNLWKTCFMAGKLAVVRNKKYLVWRYLEKPFFSYDIRVATSDDENLCGFIVTHTEEIFGLKILFVMELMVEKDDPAVCQILLDELTRISLMKGASAISFLVPPGDPNRFMYLRNGYLPIPRRLFPRDIFWAARVNSPDIEPTYARDRKNWYISWGDLDVV